MIKTQKNAIKNVLYLLLGGVVFVAVYGFAPLDITYDGWILNGYIETDITQSYAGWLAYLKADSLFPLTFSPLAAYPFGDWASLTDSSPFFAVIFKLLSPVLPANFQFFGISGCFSMAMQALAASLLLRLFCSDERQVFFGSVLFCVSPVMLERMFRHTSLASHWLVVMAIYLYFKGKTDRKTVAVKLGVLCVLTIFIHTYFAPMVVGVFLASLLDGIRSRKAGYSECITFAVSLVLCFVSMKVLGLLSMSVGDTSGYGTMGMNLNALFNPVSLDTNWWVPGGGKLHWSSVLPIRALANNNIESFNYLGLGVLLSLVCFGVHLIYLLFKNRTKLWDWIKDVFANHLFLVLFLVCCTLFAVSNVVCAFSYQLFTIPLPAPVLKLFNVFRASGRLFWPVNYILLMLSIVHWNGFEKGRKKFAVAAVAVVLAVQLVDLSPALARKHSDFEVKTEYYDNANVTAFVDAVGENDIAYFLELREDRALTAMLFKNGIANNLWLVNREGYGVGQNTDNMHYVTQQLLSGTDVYQSCAYITTNASLAQQICDTGSFGYVEINGNYIIKPL